MTIELSEYVIDAIADAIVKKMQVPTEEEKALLQKWRDNRGISMKDFEDAMDALEQEPCREADDYENEIEDLHNRLDIAEYDKERLREEVTNLEEKIKALEQEPCDDVISRAEAEAIFRNARSKLNPSDYKTADEFNTRDLMLLNAEQLIHLLPSVKPQEPKWIPVSERLPENSGNYLITYCYEDEIETQEAAYVEGEEEDKWYDITDVEITLAVIAWMPLPEPYTAESEG